jgi:hypothetical protein
MTGSRNPGDDGGVAHKPSDAENAMAANAHSRDGQGRSADQARRDLHVGMMGDGTEEQNLGQVGDPSALITQGEVEQAFASGEANLADAQAQDRAGTEGTSDSLQAPGRPS